MTADRIWGLCFTILGVAMAIASQSVAVTFPGSGDPGPRLVPLVLGVAMAALGAVLALRRPAPLSADLAAAVERSRGDAEADSPNERVEPPALWRRIALGALLLAYVAAFKHLGFSLSSTIFLAGAMILLGALSLAEILRKVAVALVIVVLLGLAMNELLGLSVQGVWLT